MDVINVGFWFKMPSYCNITSTQTAQKQCIPKYSLKHILLYTLLHGSSLWWRGASESPSSHFAVIDGKIVIFFEIVLGVM